MRIYGIESKMLYLEQMEEIHERRDRQVEGKELDISIKGMHAHMRHIELEQEEEELRERKKAFKKGNKSSADF
jgi:hypothetical protein